MDDVIYRLAAIDALTTECSWTFYDEHGQLTPNGEEIIGTLKKIPSARKKGHWNFVGFMVIECSECKIKAHELEYTNFCPNCGADMRT